MHAIVGLMLCGCVYYWRSTYILGGCHAVEEYIHTGWLPCSGGVHTYWVAAMQWSTYILGGCHAVEEYIHTGWLPCSEICVHACHYVVCLIPWQETHELKHDIHTIYLS